MYTQNSNTKQLREMDEQFLYFQVDPKEIAYISFIFEAYEGIAKMRTLNAPRGLIEIFYPAINEKEVIEIIDDLKKELVCIASEKPADYVSL